MKKLILLFSLALLSLSVMGQTTTVEVSQINDTTFVQSTVTVDDQGRELSRTNQYFTPGEFARKAVDANHSRLVGIEQAERAIAIDRRDANQLKRFVIDSLGIDYDSIAAEALLPALQGQMKLIVRNDDRTVTTLEVTRHPTNPKLLRVRETDGAKRAGNVFPIHNQRFELRGFFGEIVEFGLVNDFYRGQLQDGTVLILRR